MWWKAGATGVVGIVVVAVEVVTGIREEGGKDGKLVLIVWIWWWWWWSGEVELECVTMEIRWW